ncbi:type II toxin-antitoxin system HicA family toxin [Corticibacterium sp. UT-5YL-CI-8]|nr:type II toxin-antitoxin system HicA family toxin [Tianweitania sp. UT-5YL-CI-8]
MKREQFLRELRKLAKDRDKDIEIFNDRGKGSHYRVKLDGRMSTVKSGELSPAYLRLVKKQLGLE